MNGKSFLISGAAFYCPSMGEKDVLDCISDAGILNEIYDEIIRYARANQVFITENVTQFLLPARNEGDKKDDKGIVNYRGIDIFYEKMEIANKVCFRVMFQGLCVKNPGHRTDKELALIYNPQIDFDGDN
jgi:hypothetical protein